MKESEDNIEDIYRKRFSEEEAPVSPRVWKTIEKTLPKKDDRFSWLKGRIFISSIIAVLLMGALALFFVTTDEKKSNEMVSEKKVVEISELNNDLGSETSKEGKKEVVVKSDKYANHKTYNDGIQNTNLIEKGNKQTNNISSNSFINKENENTTNTGKVNSGSTDVTASSKSTALKADKNREKKEQGKVNGKSGETKIKRKEGIDNGLDKGKTSIAKNQKVQTKGKDLVPDNKFSLVKNKEGKVDSIRNKKNGFDANEVTTIKTTADKKTKGTSDTTSEVNNNTTSSSIADHNKKVSANQDSVFVNPKNVTGDVVSSTATINSTTGGINSSRVSKITSGIDTTYKATKDKVQNNPTIGNDSSSNKEMANQNISSILKNDSAAARDKESGFLSENKSLSGSVDSLKKTPLDTVLTEIADTIKTVEPEGNKKKEEKAKIPRWSCDLLLTPMYTGASTKALNNSYDSIVDLKNEQDKHSFNFSFGGMVNYSMTSRLSVSIGVVYARYSEKYNFKNSITYDSIYSYSYHDSIITYDTLGQPNGNKDTIMTVDTSDTHVKDYASVKSDHYSFVSIPLTVAYNFLNKEKISLTATVGVKVNMLINGVTYFRNASNTGLAESSESFAKITLSYMAALGMEYKFKPKLSLIVQPVVNFKMSSVYAKSSPVSQKPYSLGLNIGLRYRF